MKVASLLVLSLCTIVTLLSFIDVCNAIEQKWSYRVGNEIWSVAVSSDGKYAVVGSIDDKVYYFDRKGNLLWSYKTNGEVFSVAISSDGSYVVAGGRDCKVYVLDRNGYLLWSYDTGGATGNYHNVIWSVAISSDGRYIAVGTAGKWNEKYRRWDIPPPVSIF
jgi:WD40 repeat protein